MSQTRSGFSQLALADTLNAVAWARRHAVDVLRRWRVPPDTIQTARLIVSELMTNAIRHTHTDEEVSPYSPLSPVRKVTLTL
ncbi:ATP-binding protein [Kitasatospora sp. NPDC092286]|uniref:ATP-binding protein n=1 Tax=Kitasatospora sp. NPDC092286 TaxID=3364087 RepID=UPI00380F3A3C